MQARISHMAVGILSILLLLSSPVLAQENSCPAVVYYYDKTGQNTGQCLTEESPCEDMDYALEQGQRLCPEHVAVFYADPNNSYQQLEWKPPSSGREVENMIWTMAGWLGPAIGLVLGWLVAWLWVRRAHGGVA